MITQLITVLSSEIAPPSTETPSDYWPLIIGFGSTTVVTVGTVLVAIIKSHRRTESVRAENTAQHAAGSTQREEQFESLKRTISAARRAETNAHKRMNRKIDKVIEWTENHEADANERERRLRLLEHWRSELRLPHASDGPPIIDPEDH